MIAAPIKAVAAWQGSAAMRPAACSWRGQRWSLRRAVNWRRILHSSSDSLGLTTAGSSGSLLMRWSIIAVVLVAS